MTVPAAPIVHEVTMGVQVDESVVTSDKQADGASIMATSSDLASAIPVSTDGRTSCVLPSDPDSDAGAHRAPVQMNPLPQSDSEPHGSQFVFVPPPLVLPHAQTQRAVRVRSRLTR